MWSGRGEAGGHGGALGDAIAIGRDIASSRLAIHMGRRSRRAAAAAGAHDARFLLLLIFLAFVLVVVLLVVVATPSRSRARAGAGPVLFLAGVQRGSRREAVAATQQGARGREASSGGSSNGGLQGTAQGCSSSRNNAWSMDGNGRKSTTQQLLLLLLLRGWVRLLRRRMLRLRLILLLLLLRSLLLQLSLLLKLQSLPAFLGRVLRRRLLRSNSKRWRRRRGCWAQCMQRLSRGTSRCSSSRSSSDHALVVLLT